MACIAVLVGAGLVVALWHPIASPTPDPQSEAYPTGAPSLPETASTATFPPAPDPLATSPVTTPSTATTPPTPVTGTTAAPPTLGALPSLPPSQVAISAPTPGRPVPAIASGEPCRPIRLTMAGLGIEAPIVTLSLTAEGDLGTPSDRDKNSAGWFPSVLAGAARGTVLMDGHTYHDGSAIFQPTFKEQVRAGMVARLSCADGHAFSYRITEVMLDLSPADYPRFVTSRSLYAADGPAQLVLITCTDYLAAQRVWANRAVVIATPIS